MPDLLTHYTAAYFLTPKRLFPRHRVLVYLGTILPDVITRPIYILMPSLERYTVAIHTPVFMLIFCLLLSEFFQSPKSAKVRAFLLFGVGLHFFLDFFQRHFIGGYYWLFPFSWDYFEIGLFWPETPLLLSPLWLLMIAVSEGWLYLQKRKVNQRF